MKRMRIYFRTTSVNENKFVFKVRHLLEDNKIILTSLVNKKNFVLILVLISLVSCRNEDFGTPKPRTYPRVDFPKKSYSLFNPKDCNYSFEYPKYSTIEKDKNEIRGQSNAECWYNVVFPYFNGTLYLTYYKINDRKDYDKMINDSFSLTSKHDIKATGREEIEINRKNVKGILFKSYGSVASETQFFLTDTKDNFIRGSFYFRAKVQPDSIKIIQKYINEDIEHFINTFKWK